MRASSLAAWALGMALGIALGDASRAQEPAGEGQRLTLAQSLEIALRNNLDLVIARKDPAISERNVEIADAFFDPAIGAEAGANGFKSEPQRVFEAPGRGNTVNLGASWAEKLEFGGDYTVGLSTERSEGAGLFYDPAYLSGLSLTFNMPLLQNFGRDVATSQVVLARHDLDISHEELRRRAELTLEAVEGAYWDLVAVRAALDVAKQSLSLAQDLLNLNRKKVEVGTLAPIEITQAEAGVASREEGVIQAERLVGDAEDNLRKLLAIPKDDPSWEQAILPVDRPDSTPPATDLAASIEKAMERRPEMINARQELAKAELTETVSENAVKPRLDLNVTVTPYGNNLKSVTTDPLTGAPIAVIDGMGESFSEIPDLNNYGWRAGLIYSIPVGNRKAKASYAVATLNREKAALAVANEEQGIRIEVRAAVRALESGVKRVAAARANVTLQQKKLDAERKKFDNGMSTSFEVLTFQTDLLDAQVSLIRAVADYAKSLAALERVQGTLLEARGLSMEM